MVLNPVPHCYTYAHDSTRASSSLFGSAVVDLYTHARHGSFSAEPQHVVKWVNIVGEQVNGRLGGWLAKEQTGDDDVPARCAIKQGGSRGAGDKIEMLNLRCLLVRDIIPFSRVYEVKMVVDDDFEDCFKINHIKFISLPHSYRVLGIDTSESESGPLIGVVNIYEIAGRDCGDVNEEVGRNNEEYNGGSGMEKQSDRTSRKRTNCTESKFQMFLHY